MNFDRRLMWAAAAVAVAFAGGPAPAQVVAFAVENRMPPAFAVLDRCQPCGAACACDGADPALPPHPSPPGFHWERVQGKPWTLVEGHAAAAAPPAAAPVGSSEVVVRDAAGKLVKAWLDAGGGVTLPPGSDAVPPLQLQTTYSRRPNATGGEQIVFPDGGPTPPDDRGTTTRPAAPGVAAPQPFRGGVHAGHNCPSCGTAEYRVAGFNRDGTHTHTCPRCGTSWRH